MSAINQKEYLKKYLSLGSEPGKKKKRKKKPSVPSNRVKIIDDDVDTTFNEAVEEDLHGLIEDAPQIVGVIDERPLELRMSDYRDSDLWKPVGADSFAGHTGNNTNSDSAAQTNVEDHSKNVQKVTQLPSSKYSDDYSPPRKRNDRSNSRTRKSNDKDLNKSREEQRNYDASPTPTSRRREERSNRSSSETSDEGLKKHRNASPPRKGKKYHASPPRKDRKFDASPIGKNRKDAERRNREDNSPPRRDRSSEAFRQRRDSDQSPIRKNRTNDDLNRARKRTRDHDMSPIRRNRGGSDVSLERKNSDRSPARRSDLDGDMSPPRKNRKHRDASLERGNSDDSPVRRNKANDDISPPRRYARDRVLSPERRRNSGRQKNDRSPVRGNKPENVSSPSRNKRHKDLSPERRRRRRSSDRSPVRRSKINYDISPPRRSKRDRDTSPEKGNRTSVRRNKFDDDSSPPRRNLKDYEGSRKGRNQGHDYNNQSASHGKRYNHEEPGRSSSVNSGVYGKHKSDLEYRRNRTENDGSTSGKHNFGNVHDPSPNRSRNEKREESPATKSKPASSGAPRKSRWDDETPTPSVDRIHIERKSGLQRANELIEQNDFFKDIAGPSGAAVVAPIVRDRKTGKIRDFKKEEEEAAQKQEKDDAMKAKYDRWGKGLKQVEDATEKINSELHEMSKPLARYADDEDLERHLKEMERDGDPMLDYLRKKRRRHDIEAGKTFKPQFEGEFMPNRYSIRPGHRWDGVDRSNGYEKKWFEVMNSRRAQQEEAYKWSTEDM